MNGPNFLINVTVKRTLQLKKKMNKIYTYEIKAKCQIVL